MVKEILDLSKTKNLLFGTKENNGYPVSNIMQAIAYVIANDDELKGKRPIGSYLRLIEKHIARNTALTVELQIPDLLTPIVVLANNKGAMVGASNPDVYNKLISFDKDNPYKVIVRKITAEDLQ